MTAYRCVAGGGAAPGPVAHGDYRLRGGVHPVSAALANVLAHHGVRAGGAPLSEAMLFGLSGGPGAGYILWEFARDGSRSVGLGFSSQWQYIDRAALAALERLGVPAHVHRTGGAVGAARTLASTLAAGRPALVWPDRQLAGYRHLPRTLEGMGGHPVVVHGADDGHYRIDDRNLAALTVPRAAFDAARARVGSYKNLLIAPAPEGGVDEVTVRAGVTAALADMVERLGGRSSSFALPAWAKWGRSMTDPTADKGWLRVFADGRGLVGALASVWEGIEPAGTTGGSLRVLTAEFLDEAATLLGEPAATAAWRAAADAWHTLAATALPSDVPAFARLRELTAAIEHGVVADGDAGRAEAAAWAEELWRLRARLDTQPPLTTGESAELFAAMGRQVAEVHTAERTALERTVVAARVGDQGAGPRRARAGGSAAHPHTTSTSCAPSSSA